MNNNSVVLVDKFDNELGISDVEDAHLCPGFLHRAISILLYRKKDRGIELLICQRSQKKTRWPLYWSNPICTHPNKDETYLDACVRRIKEELGIRMKKKFLQFIFQFSYEASYDGILCENELDSVFIGEREGKLYPNKEEINAYKWLTASELTADLSQNPQNYTPWFQQIIKQKELNEFLSQTST